MVIHGRFGNWEGKSHDTAFDSSVTPNLPPSLVRMQIMRHILFDRLRISASIGGYQLISEEPDMIDPEQASPDIGAEFGGQEARLNLERKLLRKLDTRLSILVLIYILNYVRLTIIVWFCALISIHR
jgi:hypothetical protein